MRLIITYIFTAYLLLIFIAYFLSDFMIFFPPRPTYSKNSPGFVTVKTADGANVVAYYLPNKAAKYTLLISHGNAEDLGYMSPFLHEIHAQGYAVFAYDYRGYGLSEGRATERNTYLDIDAAYNYLTKNLQVAPENIIVFGHSVGAAVALDLAVRRPVAAVILQGAFVTAFRVMTMIPIIPFDKYNNLAKIATLKHPLLMIHGTVDSVIPFWHGEKLYKTAAVPKVFYAVKNAGHNNIAVVAGREYWETIANFIHQNLDK